MRARTILGVAGLLVAVASARVAGACGDKFLRVGRGARYQRGYVAIHPACILLYANPKSTVAGALKELEPVLQRAGHKALVVESTEAMGPALRTGHYNMILADPGDVGAVTEQARSAPVKPEIVPVVEKAGNTPALQKEYPCIVETPGKKSGALAEIDEMMEIILKGKGEKKSSKP